MLLRHGGGAAGEGLLQPAQPGVNIVFDAWTKKCLEKQLDSLLVQQDRKQPNSLIPYLYSRIENNRVPHKYATDPHWSGAARAP
eukprot:765998-Hanusia_phi.AAC.4